MAKRKTKAEEVEETTETAKKTSKKAKQLQITYEPRFSASEKKTIILREPVQVAVGDTVKTEYKNKVDGLPPVLTLEKGEKFPVTLEQFKALYELGYIDTPEDIEERERERLKYNTQPGADPRSFKVAAKRSHLYEDNFILVE